MANGSNEQPGARSQRVYQIRIRGHLGPRWADWFDGLTAIPDANGDTLLVGPVVDQAALHGVLRRVRDLGLPLLSVILVDDAPTPNRQCPPDRGSEDCV